MKPLYTLASGVSGEPRIPAMNTAENTPGTKTITLPDNAQVSANLKLRLRDPVRGYEGSAAGHFRIRGGFEFRMRLILLMPCPQALTGDNTAHNIKWYNKGSFANVKLEYATSTNGTAWGAYQGIIDPGQQPGRG